ncbi:MAG: ferritin family protein [candidate division Zixibacteria bacterium]|nr:ferritin family protein [candidate division Zixibacteria bacterium]
MKLDTIEKILEFAIAKEEEANAFYMDLARRMDKAHLKAIFEDFAREELGHKQKLLGVKSGRLPMPSTERVQDLKIGDHLVEVTPGKDSTFQDALVVAMKAEKAAFKLYTELAEAADKPETKNLFLSLAQEEARHKLRFEIEYDQYTYKEN